MIDVESLTRYYNKTPAVNNVSFSIEQRQIVGLLGHNGAGKSTVMKMLSGCLEPSAGSVRIRGLDIHDHKEQIQRRLGYLPENLPVYSDLSVADYLDYCATLKGLRGDDKRRAVRYSVDATALGERYLSTIGELSRGFKQRVGVAQAILGSPELLILDEPGNGLDPQQNEQMRALIREIAANATVLLSTHIMQEVDALCDRVLVMSNGALALDSSLAELRQSDALLVTTSVEDRSLSDLLQRLPQVKSIDLLLQDDDRQQVRVNLHSGTAFDTAAGNISRILVEADFRVFELGPERQDLEQLFSDAVKTVGASDAA